jgi:signal transduction histidine kinase
MRARKSRASDSFSAIAAAVAASAAAAVVPYVVLGLVVATALAALVGLLTVRADEIKGARSFDQLAAVVAGSVVAPQLTPQFLAGEPAALDQMHRTVASLINARRVSQVTIRNGAGQVVWPRAPGAGETTRGLRPSELRALQTQSVVPGTGADPRSAAAGIRDANGTPALVVVAAPRGEFFPAGATWTRFTLVSLAALLALELAQLPLAYGLGRRTRNQRRAEAALELATAEAADNERRRVAAAVHDFVIPEMTGLAYDLDAARLDPPGADATAALVARAAQGLRRNIGELRSVVSGLTQTRAPEGGLDTALRVLGDRLGGADTGVSVRMEAAEPLPRPVAELLYRCAQESLRNVATHSRADQVEIVVEQNAEKVTMTIDDDGCGFDEARMAERTACGHVGLRSLGDLVAQVGGSVTARSAPGQGTRVAVTLPLAAAASRGPVR